MEQICRTYSIEETAQVLGIGRSLAYEAARRGEIPVIKIGNRYLVPRSWIDKNFGAEPLSEYRTS